MPSHALEPSQRGRAFAHIDASAAQEINVQFDMYIGDGTGADGLCCSIGNNNIGGRVEENGVTQGMAFCFDEWSNGATESGVHIFYNGQNGGVSWDTLYGGDVVIFPDERLL